MNTLLPNFRLEYDSLWNLLPKNVPSLEVTPETVLNQSRSRFDSDVGFYHLPIHTAVESVQAMENLAQKWRAQLDGVVIFGIGGSFLGPAAVVESLKRCDDPFQILWLSNSDGPEIKRVAHAIQNKRFGAVVISKSGTTVETLTSFFHLSRHFKNEHIAVVTDPEKGELRRLTLAQNWASFPIPHNIGGRFSVLSAVGLLPTALAGLSASSLISGAKLMREALERFPQEENPALQLAESIFRWDKQLKRNVHVLMPYEKRLKLFADWWVQLFGESIGKKQTVTPHDSVGFTPLAALGTTDQHSMLQLFKEGPQDKMVGFISVFRSDSGQKVERPPFEVKGFDYFFDHTFEAITHYACLATEQSLKNSGTPTFRLECHDLNESTFGSLFFFFETVCAYAGEFYQVNAYDQPGVEETKKILKARLSGK